MTEPKKPQDRLSKSGPAEEFFTFTVDGDEYTMPKRTVDVITTKFIRKNRRRDETDYTFTALEELAGDDDEIIDAIDSLSRSGLNKLVENFQRHIGAALGE